MADITVKKLTIGNGEDSYTLDTTKFVEMDEHGHVPVETIPSDDTKADKANTVLTTTLSRGRKNNTTVGAASFAFGEEVEASFDNTHAEGYYTRATRRNAHAEGDSTIAENESSHAEGYHTQASGSYSHAEGNSTQAGDGATHAEGFSTIAYGLNSHAEGNSTYTGAANAHAEGRLTTVYGINAHAEGYNTNANGESAHAEGISTRSAGQASHAEGYSSKATASGSHAEGSYTEASGNDSHAEGYNTKSIGGYTHAEGCYTKADGYSAHAEGYTTAANGWVSHAEGYGASYTENDQTYTPGAYGSADHVEGYQNISGTTRGGSRANHAEGYRTQATGNDCHSEGLHTIASGNGSHTEGTYTVASGIASHAEGSQNTASGSCSHAEGGGTVSKGYCSHAEGYYTIASADHSHIVGSFNAEDTYANWSEWEASHSYAVGDKIKRTETEPNTGTIVYTGYICNTANSDSTFDFTKWDLDTKRNFVEIVGNGYGDFISPSNIVEHRSNARAVDWEGNEYLKGNLYVNCNSDSTGGTRVATLADIAGFDGGDLFYICASGEYDTTTGVPTIQNPSTKKLYLVPNQNGSSPNLFIEWIYSNNAWESVGSATIDISSKADKTNTVLLTTLSRGRQDNTTIGDASFAFGNFVTASGTGSFAIGAGTQALGDYSVTGGGGVTVSGEYSVGFGGGVTVSGDYSFGFGGGTYVGGNTAVGIGSGVHALGLCSSAFGGGNRAYGDYSFVSGGGSVANGYGSTAIGDGLIANGGYSFVHGTYNVADTSNEYPEWVSDTQYYEHDIVKVTMEDSITHETHYNHYECIYDNNDHEFTDWKWSKISNPRTYAEIVGGGSDDNNRRNIRTLDWDGNETILGKFKGRKLEIGDYAYATGTQSFAIGSGATASGTCAMSKGFGTTASNTCSTALGQGAVASGICSLANGSGVTATGSNAVAFGASTMANGSGSMALGWGTVANGSAQFVFGQTNVAETVSDYDNWPTWVANTSYSVGNTIKKYITVQTDLGNGNYTVSTTTHFYECIEANSDSEFDVTKWKERAYGSGKYLEIVGNEVWSISGQTTGSNARALDWDGNEYLAGDIYVRCNNDSTGGYKLITSNDIPVNDIQVKGVTIVNNGIANIPAASGNTLGLIKVRTGNDGLNKDSLDHLCIAAPSDATVKAGTDIFHAVTVSKQHIAAYYALSKLAGVDLANETVAVGTYPESSKQAIQKMFGLEDLLGPYEMDSTADRVYAVGEPFIYNGKQYKATAAIALGDVIAPGTGSGYNCEPATAKDLYVKKTDIASSSTAGVVKVGGSGLLMDNNGFVNIDKANDDLLKAGSNNYRPIVPGNQHKSIYYGLSKLAGVDLKNEAVTVGTYPTASKEAILTMLGSVSKDSLDNAGITARTYTEKFGGEFSVTTAADQNWLKPHARASVTGRISKHYKHLVIFNGTEYELPTRLWYSADNGAIKVYEYLGNLSLYISDVSGVPDLIDNVPFVIISDLNDSNSIDVLTQTAGTYTILVKQIAISKTDIPKSLIYEDEYVPILKKNDGGTYNGTSIGVNELKDARGTVAIGYGNKTTGDFATAIGLTNTVYGGIASGDENNVANYGFAFGRKNTISGHGGCAYGVLNTADTTSFAFGHGLIASNGITVFGRYNVEDSGFDNWQPNTEYTVGKVVKVENIAVNFTCVADHTSSSTFISDYSSGKWQPGDMLLSDTAVLFGIGKDSSHKINGLRIDYDGNVQFKGDVYVDCNADSSGGTKLVKETDVATTSSRGVVKIDPNFGVALRDSPYQDVLMINRASDGEIKQGNQYYKPIVSVNQHKAVFYGLAKAAGDTTQSQSDNAVGNYTQTAKTAIQTMLGIDANIPLVETVSGATPSITGEPNVRYVCTGTVTELTITPPQSGTIVVRFTAGSNCIISLPNTVKLPEWFDISTDIEAGKTYEFFIEDGVYGGVMSWAA